MPLSEVVERPDMLPKKEYCKPLFVCYIDIRNLFAYYCILFAKLFVLLEPPRYFSGRVPYIDEHGCV